MRTFIDDELYPQDSGIERANRPGTFSVLVVLMFAAVTISYLVAYAAPSALVSAKVLQPWQYGGDPRPRWMLLSFIALMGGFVVITGLFRVLSRLQMKDIDATANDA
jgi:hypothetical protein